MLVKFTELMDQSKAAGLVESEAVQKKFVYVEEFQCAPEQKCAVAGFAIGGQDPGALYGTGIGHPKCARTRRERNSLLGECVSVR